MDINYFLRERLAFIEKFYVDSAAIFIERKRKIEAKEESVGLMKRSIEEL